MRVKVIPASASKAKTARDERTIFWHPGLPGFGLMVTGAGDISYVVQYANGQRSRRIKLGNAGALSFIDARNVASALLGHFVPSSRPQRSHRRIQQAKRTDTVQAIGREYLRHEAKRGLRSARSLLLCLEHPHRSALENHVHRPPRLGDRRSLFVRVGIR